LAFISITRLRVRSFLYLPQFLWQASKSSRQAERSPGFLGGRLMRNPKNTFWTMTAWTDDAAMSAYRIAGAHSTVMPKLRSWCDEASVTHWNQGSPELPSWQEAHRRMVGEGRLSKVNHPSPSQVLSQIPAPTASPVEQVLKPAENH
jgi:hypothetical protein